MFVCGGVCVCVCVLVCVNVCESVSLSVCLSVCFSVSLSVCDAMPCNGKRRTLVERAQEVCHLLEELIDEVLRVVLEVYVAAHGPWRLWNEDVCAVCCVCVHHGIQ